MTTVHRQQGFTLIELMSVVTIIGLLASIALPAYQNYMTRAKIAEGFALIAPIKKSIGDYYAYTGKLPTNNKMAGLPEPEQLRGNYVTSITVEDGAIHVIMNRKMVAQLKKDETTISVRPAILPVYPPNATLAWYCGPYSTDKKLTVFGKNKTTVNFKYLPSICR